MGVEESNKNLIRLNPDQFYTLYTGKRPHEWSQYSNVRVNEGQIEEVGFSISQMDATTGDFSLFERRVS